MTREEWDKLSKEEYLGLSEEERLKHFIKFTEERYIWYKKQLEWVFKDKETWPPDDEITIWYREDLRFMKNKEEGDLKELRIEMEHCREGLNPPWCYPDYKRRKFKEELDKILSSKGAAITLDAKDLDKILFKS